MRVHRIKSVTADQIVYILTITKDVVMKVQFTRTTLRRSNEKMIVVMTVCLITATKEYDIEWT